MAVSLWFLHEYVTVTDAEGQEVQRWFYRRTFYDPDDLAFHLDVEAPYLYNPNPRLRISRVELPTAEETETRLQTPGAEPIEDQAAEQPASDPGAEPSGENAP